MTVKILPTKLFNIKRVGAVTTLLIKKKLQPNPKVFIPIIKPNTVYKNLKIFSTSTYKDIYTIQNIHQPHSPYVAYKGCINNAVTRRETGDGSPGW